MADGGSAVGFGFQTDVVNLGSLTHLITGRILKAMSDGGIDFYAVAAAMWLGKYVPVQSSLQTTVHAHIQAKSTHVLHGFLAKALSIGWGHSAIPLEMSRTKAGTNALLFIGALSTGCSPYVAAQGLSEVLTICGLEPDKAPTVDVLKPLIAYLAPFVQDMGFSKVLQHITTAVSAKALKLFPHLRDDHLQYRQPVEPNLGVFPDLESTGEAPVLAAAIKQLIFTSERKEYIYFVVHQRGAWLAAFANHILGMEVEVSYRNTVLWASVGAKGRVVFALGHSNEDEDALQPVQSCSAGVHLVVVPSNSAGKAPISLDYAFPEALECELGLFQLSEPLKISIHGAIVRLSSALLEGLHMKTSWDSERSHFINGRFPVQEALRKTLADFRIASTAIEKSLKGSRRVIPDSHYKGEELRGLAYLDNPEAQALQHLCGRHGTLGYGSFDCVCRRVGGIIHGFASTIIALVQCRYDHTDLRVSSDVLNGKIVTSWSNYCKLHDVKYYIPGSETLFHHLRQLFQIPSPLDGDQARYMLGVSGGSCTVYYTMLIQEDCYDDWGRSISISAGRACAQGMLRHDIVDSKTPELAPYSSYRHRPAGPFTSLVSGAFIEPHLYPTKLGIFMDVNITENEIAISTKVGAGAFESLPVNLALAMGSTFYRVSPGMPCAHRCRERVQMNDGDSVLCGFDSFLETPSSSAKRVFVALRGKKLQQIIYLHSLDGLLKTSQDPVVLQLYSCLKCCLDLASRTTGGSRSWIIMGG